MKDEPNFCPWTAVLWVYLLLGVAGGFAAGYDFGKATWKNETTPTFKK